MRRLTVSIMFLLLALTGFSPAQTRREDEPFCDDKFAKRVEITDEDAAILGFKIGHATIKDVQARLGSANVVRVSREEESDVSICYLSPVDGTVLVFYTGVMGGGKDITWFAVWSREAAYPHVSRCTPSKLVTRSLRTQSGLRLGLTKSEFERIVGKPTQDGPKAAEYNYLCRRKMTEDEIKSFKTGNNWDVSEDPYFDRMSWIEAWYRDSTTSRIEIGEIESY
jgi:hypothetical protein